MISARQRPVRRDSPTWWQLRDCLAIPHHLPSRRLAKGYSATLGAVSPTSKLSQADCKTSLVLRHTVSSSRFYRFGTPKHSVAQNTQAGAPGPKASAFPEPEPASHVSAKATIAALDRAKDSLVSQDGIPSEHDVLTTLLHCSRAASLAVGAPVRRIPKKASGSDTAASSLLSLDASPAEAKQRLADKGPAVPRSSDVVDYISHIAFEVVTQPSVLITPKVLEAYVTIQARLGKVETLPHVLSLYASKPKPRVSGGVIEYVQQNPDKTANALDPRIIEKALDTAIEAKNLDVAIGIIENTYTTRAFARKKVLSKALLPVSIVATAPFAAYLLASHLAHFQDSLDHGSATAVATGGILACFGITGTLGLLAALTQNDHMKRVTWAPGVSLSERFLREEERAALDKVACSIGFSDTQRHGEEEGAEYEVLRQFILGKGMILDRVELMEGMS